MVHWLENLLTVFAQWCEKNSTFILVLLIGLLLVGALYVAVKNAVKNGVYEGQLKVSREASSLELSEVLRSCIGNDCFIQFHDVYPIGGESLDSLYGEIIQVDRIWVKICCETTEGEKVVEAVRLALIDSVSYSEDTDSETEKRKIR